MNKKQAATKMHHMLRKCAQKRKIRPEGFDNGQHTYPQLIKRSTVSVAATPALRDSFKGYLDWLDRASLHSAAYIQSE